MQYLTVRYMIICISVPDQLMMAQAMLLQLPYPLTMKTQEDISVGLMSKESDNLQPRGQIEFNSSVKCPA